MKRSWLLGRFWNSEWKGTQALQENNCGFQLKLFQTSKGFCITWKLDCPNHSRTGINLARRQKIDNLHKPAQLRFDGLDVPVDASGSA